MAIEYGLSTHEQEAIKLNGSEFTSNVDKLTIENEKLKTANGEDGNRQPAQNQSIQNSIQTLISEAAVREVNKIAKNDN